MDKFSREVCEKTESILVESMLIIMSDAVSTKILPDGRSVIKFAADCGEPEMVKIFLTEAIEKHNQGVIDKFSHEVCTKTERDPAIWESILNESFD